MLLIILLTIHSHYRPYSFYCSYTIQHTLTIHGVMFLKTPTNGKTVLRDIKTLCENGVRGTKIT
jgi:hypothetical protein